MGIFNRNNIYRPPFQTAKLDKIAKRLLQERGEDHHRTLAWLHAHRSERDIRSAIVDAWKATQLPLAELSSNITRVGLYCGKLERGTTCLGIGIELEHNNSQIFVQQAPWIRDTVSKKLSSLLDVTPPSPLIDAFCAAPGLIMDDGVLFTHPEFITAPGLHLQRGSRDLADPRPFDIRNDTPFWPKDAFAFELAIDEESHHGKYVVVDRYACLLISDGKRHQGLMPTAISCDAFLRMFYETRLSTTWDKLLEHVPRDASPILQTRPGQHVQDAFDGMSRDGQLCVACHMLVSLARCRNNASVWQQLRAICEDICRAFIKRTSIPPEVMDKLLRYSDPSSTIKLISNGVDREAILLISQMEFLATSVQEESDGVLYPRIALSPNADWPCLYELAQEAMDEIQRETDKRSSDPTRSALRILLDGPAK